MLLNEPLFKKGIVGFKTFFSLNYKATYNQSFNPAKYGAGGIESGNFQKIGRKGDKSPDGVGLLFAADEIGGIDDAAKFEGLVLFHCENVRCE